MTACQYELRREHQVRLQSASREYFLRNASQVLTRTQITDHVWNYECGFETNLVDVYVRYLRAKIDNGETTKLLHTVRGTGYVLRAEV